MTTTQHDDPRGLIRHALVGIAFMVALAWTLFLVRETLLPIYMAALVAIGLSPIVNWIQRHQWTPRNMPRWSAILITYLLFIGILVAVATLVLPPLIEQARELWAERIVALLIGGSLLGIVGAILAVPSAAILQVLIHELVPETKSD